MNAMHAYIAQIKGGKVIKASKQLAITTTFNQIIIGDVEMRQHRLYLL